MTVFKKCYLIGACQNRQKGNDVFGVFSEYHGSDTEGISITVYGGLTIYILTLAALCVWKHALFDMKFIKVNQNANLYDFTENG